MTDVWNTIANMKVLDDSIESFFQVLASEIEKQDCWKFKTSEQVAALATPMDWCWYAIYMRYSLYRIGGGERRVPGDLTVGVELWREVIDQENAWVYAKQPLIYTGFSPKTKNGWWSENMALDYRKVPAQYPGGEIISPTKDAPYLWKWNGEDQNRWSRCKWFFVLPLFSIGSREDVGNEIIAPLRSLLVNNSDSNTAFEGRQAIPF